MDDAPGVMRHIRLMRHHDDRDALLAVEAAEQLHDFVAALAVKVAGRLVSKQHQRVGDDGAGDGNTLLLAAGKLGRGVVFPSIEADFGQCGTSSGVTGFHRFATIEQRQFDILLRRSAREQVEALKDKTEAIAAQQGALVAVEPLNVDAAKAIFAGGRVSRQPSRFIAVDLPEPLGPITATKSPASMRRLTPRSAWKAA
jgi:hypothetical protein